MGTLDRLLVPLTVQSRDEAKLLSTAEEQAHAFGATVILLHVLPAQSMAADGSVSVAEALARTYLDTAAARLRAAGIAVQPLLRTGPVAATVLDVAQEQDAGLIIIGCPLRTGLLRLLPAGIAEQVARHAPCPVLLVRPDRREHDRHPPNKGLRNFADDAARAGPVSPRFLGHRTVEAARIIGSVARPGQAGAGLRRFDKRPSDDRRFRRLLAAMERGEPLRPVELYKLGFGYYVLDGHYRVAAAIHLGQLWIDTVVTEFLVLADAAAQRVFAARRAFEQQTGLTQVGAARVESYARLEALIREYAAVQGCADLREAAARWYASLFRPLQRRLRSLRLAQYFPGERTADVFLRLWEHRQAESARLGRPLTWDDALQSFVAAQRAQGSVRRAA